jgi:hypothetical protein
MDLSSASVKSSGHLPNAPNTRLHGRLFILARAAWIIVALSALSILIIGLPVYFALLQTACSSVAACAVNGTLMSEDMHTLHGLGISTETYAVYMVLLTVATSLVWMVVGWLIFWHRSDEGMALFVALLLVTFSASGASGDALAFVYPTWTLPVKLVGLLGVISIGLLFYLFPTGRFVPRWTRWLAMVYIIYEVLSLGSPPDSPINASWLSGFIFLLFLGIGLYALIYRYRRVSTAVQRQ